MFKLFNKITNIIKNQGFLTLFRRVRIAFPKRIQQIRLVILALYRWKAFNNKIKTIINFTDYDFVDIMDVSFGWTLNLFQRPQHIAQQLSKQNILVIYGMNILESDKLSYPVHELSENLYCIDLKNPIVKGMLFNAIKRRKIKSVYHVYSTNVDYNYNDLVKQKRKNFVVYEYIDSISLSRDTIVRNRHNHILNDKEIGIVVTADKLRDEVRLANHDNYLMITNGTDFNHWYGLDKDYGIDCPLEMRSLVKKRKIIIGYYGALTHDWFDYDIIFKLANSRKDIVICLIGPLNYVGPSGESSKKYFDALKSMDNVTLIDAIAYKDLPNYAKYFDICIIPFKVNEITLSTSPVKLFEYMAMGKPIITTKMPECLKYPTVLVADNEDHFINLLGKGISLASNEAFVDKQISTSRENSWTIKSMEFKNYILERI